MMTYAFYKAKNNRIYAERLNCFVGDTEETKINRAKEMMRKLNKNFKADYQYTDLLTIAEHENFHTSRDCDKWQAEIINSLERKKDSVL